MCLVVTGVSTLIHLYSVSYMTSDRGFTRYFSFLNFFVFSMLLLVLAGNFVLLVIGWAFVGYASYALISFWYRRETATRAGMKAFVINVIGDVGLVFATFFVFRELGTFDYPAVFSAAPQHFHTNQGVVVAICLLLCVGAFAKSAQLPLHTWLPDAMEGPTPVSALIHAATMVTAGVYLIARMWPLFELAPTAADIAAFVGLATLLFAGTVALAVTDLKRIIAYSTCSQIGYMIMGVSIGAYSAGLFQLMTHAFFKALLFMAAGSVIGAMAGNQDIDRMSGFRKSMPFTSALLVVGSLALAGFAGTSGFFSKDEILDFAASRGGMYWIFAIGGYVGALLTAFYAFRIGFRVTRGEPSAEARELEGGHLAHAEPSNPATGEPEDTDVGFPGAEHHIAERELPMRIAMAILGVLALFGGLVQVPGVDEGVTRLPRRHVRGLAPRLARAERRRELGGARGGRRHLDPRHLPRLPLLRPQPGHHDPPDRALRRNPHLPEEQVVLRRGLRRGDLPPDRRRRALRKRRLRARRGAGHRLRHHRGRPRRRRARPRRPVGLRARLRAASRRRLRRARPLLPDREPLVVRR